jgi:antitoxin (DNA-binding transcriptional repressor) of toxin-antitoxin stability system
MKTIPATEFKQKALEILDTVSDEGIIITKRGKPVAKLTRLRGPNAQWIGSMKGKIKIKGNILSTGIKWRAES